MQATAAVNLSLKAKAMLVRGKAAITKPMMWVFSLSAALALSASGRILIQAITVPTMDTASAKYVAMSWWLTVDVFLLAAMALACLLEIRRLTKR